ncbi:MAG: 30S ribosomal protein S7 [Candidatus Buchananbacteria bacterium RIFCSPHIGHO2_02_FULL_45_11b]|uniref:Small ribosomal subunit protein uS7 n=4 Tax=Candidatus Buchananiibacteriota TaxID=1817903 RepID=A0A1G1Y5B4_9BACT|nr:MAG: 30S ribosomal protein S7 [Candidatus Buchananbacteria bacterium RIFCSPHIGHO2_01_FULL_46_12]OGY50506.1 MAG: 30S ribosomal protein S7 [Candidatus Buchananbacteria bacterium RIFCSPHIGHO2_02_FULL_45_11b]OGY53444.1 MAG: 30S ribosomal protein S7 [Candidatus Buchananbacteria bacterium RIFCSPLOWO2_01_FULL_45_31]OGY57080.1 MAG: 30S ribosomal protein S7 [Candidatus Buchananbacteria bacterium RIFCSPLOWO2_02_FULL_46_11b]
MRGKTPKRKITPDPKFHSVGIAKFINHIMRRGKKATAQRVVYDCFEIIKEKTKKDPLPTFDLAIKNVGPEVEVKSKRIGGGNYQIPIAVVGNRRLALAHRWLIAAAKAKKGAPMSQKLAEELIAASNKEGAAIKKRQDVYRMAEANRAFAHFAR